MASINLSLLVCLPACSSCRNSKKDLRVYTSKLQEKKKHPGKQFCSLVLSVDWLVTVVLVFSPAQQFYLPDSTSGLSTFH